MVESAQILFRFCTVSKLESEKTIIYTKIDFEQH